MGVDTKFKPVHEKRQDRGQDKIDDRDGDQREKCFIGADFEDNGKIVVRYAPGEYDADSFPKEAQEITVSGNDSAKVDGIEPGGYTVLVTAADDLNGTAVIW